MKLKSNDLAIPSDTIYKIDNKIDENIRRWMKHTNYKIEIRNKPISRQLISNTIEPT